jgi:hypothetical protein
MNVYNQVKKQKMDYVVINDQLNKNRNGAGRVQSCAFSREWNKRYQESASFECDLDNDRCTYRQENDGDSEWQINYDSDHFEYINKKFHFGYQVGVNFDFTEEWYAGFEFTHTLSAISDDERNGATRATPEISNIDCYDSHPYAFQFRVGYRF